LGIYVLNKSVVSKDRNQKCNGHLKMNLLTIFWNISIEIL